MRYHLMRLTRLLPVMCLALCITLTGDAFAQEAKHDADPHANAEVQGHEQASDRIDEAVQRPGEAGMHGDAHAGHNERSLVPDPLAKATWLEAAYTIVVFVLFFLLLSVFVWPKVLASLRAREDKVRGDLKHAEDAAKQASTTLAEYKQQLAEAQKQAQQIVDESRGAAQKVAAQLRDEAQAQITQMRERAEADINAAKERAVSDIYERGAALATQVAGQILRREINAGDQAALISESINKLRDAGQN